MSNFFVPAKNTSGPGWSSVATAGTSMGWLILVQLSLHLSCLCSSSLIFNLQDWKVEHVEIIVVPGKREGIDNHCLWFPDAKTHIYPFAYILILVVKRYMSGFPNFSTILCKRARLSFHSVASSSALDCLSASILIVPGVCAAATYY